MAKKNLVRTKLGLVDRDKGKLVVSIRGLPGAIDWDPETNTFGDQKEQPKPAAKKTKKKATKKATKKTTKKATKKATKTEEKTDE